MLSIRIAGGFNILASLPAPRRSGPDRDAAVCGAFAVAGAMQRAPDLESLTNAVATGLRQFGPGYCYVAEIGPDDVFVLTGTKNTPLHDPQVRRIFHHVIAPLAGVLHRSGPATLSELAIRPDTCDTFAPILEGRRRSGFGEAYYSARLVGDGRTYIGCIAYPGLGSEDRDLLVMGKILVDCYAACAVRLATQDQRRSVATPLTPRQQDCLVWVRAGKSSTDIGDILGISANTVNEHVAQACARLGVRTRVQAVTRAIELGLIGLPAAPPRTALGLG